MPRAKKTTTTTARARKPATAKAPAGMIDTTADTIEDAEPRVAPPKEQKAGPKKVLSETGKAIADAGAVVLVKGSAGNDNKGIHFDEAQSITHPLVRLIGRHLKKLLPSWARSMVPSVKIDPDDLADLEEIGLTLGKYALRIAMLMVQDFVEGKEKAHAAKQQQAAQGAPVPTPMQRPMQVPAHLQMLDRQVQEPVATPAVPSSNGHNPMFDAIGSDFGLTEGA